MIYKNTGIQRRVGTYAFFNVTLTPKWTVCQWGPRYLLHVLAGNYPGADGRAMTIGNTDFNLGGRLMSQLQLSKGWSAQSFSFWRSMVPRRKTRSVNNDDVKSKGGDNSSRRDR